MMPGLSLASSCRTAVYLAGELARTVETYMLTETSGRGESLCGTTSASKTASMHRELSRGTILALVRPAAISRSRTLPYFDERHFPRAGSGIGQVPVAGGLRRQLVGRFQNNIAIRR